MCSDRWWHRLVLCRNKSSAASHPWPESAMDSRTIWYGCLICRYAVSISMSCLHRRKGQRPRYLQQDECALSLPNTGCRQKPLCDRNGDLYPINGRQNLSTDETTSYRLRTTARPDLTEPSTASPNNAASPMVGCAGALLPLLSRAPRTHRA